MCSLNKQAIASMWRQCRSKKRNPLPPPRSTAKGKNKNMQAPLPSSRKRVRQQEDDENENELSNLLGTQLNLEHKNDDQHKLKKRFHKESASSLQKEQSQLRTLIREALEKRRRVEQQHRNDNEKNQSFRIVDYSDDSDVAIVMDVKKKRRRENSSDGDSEKEESGPLKRRIRGKNGSG
jgi:hypothetical protein